MHQILGLVLLVAQIVGLVLLMSYSRTSRSAENEPLYLALTAIFIMEVMKLVLWYQRGGTWYTNGNFVSLRTEFTLNSTKQSLVLGAHQFGCRHVPSVLPALKILTTALFLAVLLARKFSAQKWAALVVLSVGVCGHCPIVGQ
jgi:solute carrier family 35 (UDP-sugar transporter), member A1/2/3